MQLFPQMFRLSFNPSSGYKCLNSSYRNIKIEITCGYMEQYLRHTAKESTVQIVCLFISVEFDIT